MDAYQEIPLNQIAPSRTNPRKHFAADKLQELAESIKAKGVLQPVLVRPIGGELPLGDLVTVRELDVAIKTQSALVAFGLIYVGDIRTRAMDLIANDFEGNYRSAVYEAIKTVPGVTSMGDVTRVAEAMAPDASTGFELVAGERRYRAAKMAGLAEIPATIRTLTDIEVLEVQVVENDQREDTLPSERAAGYQRLIDAKVPAEEIAKKIGKSVSWIRGYLKIGNLSPDVLDAVDSGFLPRATAELVARVPGEKARRTVELCVLQNEWSPSAAKPKGKPAEEPKSFRETKELLERHFMVELKGSPFDQKDATLVPSAGSCKDCPKRAGNAGDEFKGVRADVCLDTECYRSKKEAARQRVEEEAKRGGRRVLSAAEAKKAFSEHGRGLAYNSPYLDLSAKCYEDAKCRTYRTLLAGELPDEDVVIGFDREGDRFELVLRTVADKLLRSLKVLGQGSRSSGSEPWRRDMAKQRKKAEAGKKAAVKANEAACNRAMAAFGQISYWPAEAVGLLQQIVSGIIDHSWADASRDVSKRRDLEGEERHACRIQKLAQGITSGPQLMGLLAEITSARLSQFWGSSHWSGDTDVATKGFWEAIGVNPKKLLKQSQEEAKKPKAKAQPSANGKAHKTNGVHKPQKRKAVPA